MKFLYALGRHVRRYVWVHVLPAVVCVGCCYGALKLFTMLDIFKPILIP